MLFDDFSGVIVIVGVLAFCAYYIYRFFFPRRIEGLPVADDEHWLLGHLPLLVESGKKGKFHVLMNTLRQDSSRNFQIRTPGLSYAILCTPESVISATKFPEGVGVSDTFSVPFRLLSDGVLVMDPSPEHARRRRLLAPAFGPRTMKRVVRESARRAMQVARVFATSSEYGDVVKMSNLMGRLTLDVFGACTLGSDFGAVSNFGCDSLNSEYGGTSGVSILEDMHTLAVSLEQRVNMPPFLWRFLLSDHAEFQGAIDRLKTFVEDRSRARVQSLQNNNNNDDDDNDAPLLDALLRGQSGKDSLSDDDIIDELCLFCAAGHETTASTLAWILVELSRHPLEQAKIREELFDVLGPLSDDDDDDNQIADLLTWEKLCQLPILDRSIKETMRLWPVAAVTSRVVNVDGAVVDGCPPLPRGTSIIVDTRAAHTDKGVWGEDALEWRPSRWIAKDGSTITPPEGGYQPFSVGTKSCLGTSFAKRELFGVLAVLLRKVEFMMDPGADIEGVLTLTLRPELDLPIRARKVTSK